MGTPIGPGSEGRGEERRERESLSTHLTTSLQPQASRHRIGQPARISHDFAAAITTSLFHRATPKPLVLRPKSTSQGQLRANLYFQREQLYLMMARQFVATDISRAQPTRKITH